MGSEMCIRDSFNVAAFVGQSSNTNYEENHFASDISGFSNAVGGNSTTGNTGFDTDVTGATLAELQAVTMPGENGLLPGENGLFVGWDETIWDFGDSTELPQLINVGPSP